MYDAAYELGSAAVGYSVRIRARGRSVLSNPMLNRGTAFTDAERRLGLQGQLSSGMSTLEGAAAAGDAQYRRQPDDWRNVFLANLRDRNEVLFYRAVDRPTRQGKSHAPFGLGGRRKGPASAGTSPTAHQ
jgi:hypothetical protein